MPLPTKLLPPRGKGGFFFVTNPDLQADQVAVWWRAESLARAVHLQASSFGDVIFAPQQWPGRTESTQIDNDVLLVLCLGGVKHRIFADPGVRDGYPVAARLDFDRWTVERAEAATQLWRVLTDHPAQPDGEKSDQARARIGNALRAFDGRRDGATLREIARALFAESRLEFEPWKASSLRAAVIGLVAAGERLVAGGYFDLLRPRKRARRARRA